MLVLTAPFVFSPYAVTLCTVDVTGNAKKHIFSSGPFFQSFLYEKPYVSVRVSVIFHPAHPIYPV